MTSLGTARSILRTALTAPAGTLRLALLTDAVASVEETLASGTAAVPPSSAMPWLPSYALACCLATHAAEVQPALDLMEAAHACCVEQARLGMGTDAHFGVVGTSLDLARLRERAGDRDGARALSRRALFVSNNAYNGGDALLSADAVALSGELLRRGGELDDAVRAFSDAREQLRRMKPGAQGRGRAAALGLDAALGSTLSATLRAGGDATMAPDCVSRAAEAVTLARKSAAARGSGAGGALWSTASEEEGRLSLGLAHAAAGELTLSLAVWRGEEEGVAAEPAESERDARGAALAAALAHNVAHVESQGAAAAAAAERVVAEHGGRLGAESDGALLWAPPLIECSGAALALAFDDADG